MEALQCSKCSTQDHHGHGSYFCLCEDRNIKLAKELRERGINVWKKPETIEVYADDEEDFVEKSLSTPRPCVIWMKGDFDQQKIDEICKRKGVFFIKTNINGTEGTICLPQKPDSDQVSDSKSLRIKWPEKESKIQMPSLLQ